MLNKHNDVNKYNKYNIVYGAIKMRLADVKSRMFMEHGVDHNDKDPKIKVGSNISVSKNKIILAKDYIPNSSEEDFDIYNIKKTIR